jgi:hypothetical protein
MTKIFLENFKVSLFSSKSQTYVYVYNNNHYCFIKIAKAVKLCIKNSNCVEILNSSVALTSKATNGLNSFLKQFYFYEHSKIKFAGKGYKIKKNSNKSIILLFNRAHITIAWWRNLFLKKHRKYKVYIRHSVLQKSMVDLLLNVRRVNFFTKKGLRTSKQILYKKKGKK